MRKFRRPPRRIGLAFIALFLFAIIGGLANRDAWATVDQAAYAYYFERDPKPGWYQLVGYLTRTGDFVGYSLAALYAIYLTQRARYRFVGFATLILGCPLLIQSTKWFYGRIRPGWEWLPSHVGFSYPSGHTLFSTVFYGYLGYAWVRAGRRPWVGALLFCWPFIIGWTRVVLGWHWVSDVVGGLLLGSAWLLTCIQLVLDKPAPETPLESVGIDP